MAEQAPEGRKKDNVLTRKIGPLPTWAWVSIVAAAILLYAWHKAGKSTTSPPADTAGAGQVPQFVNQTYVSPEPPEPEPPPKRRKPHHRRDRDHDEDDDGSRHHRPQPRQPGGSRGGPPVRGPIPEPRRHPGPRPRREQDGPGRDRRGNVAGVTGG